MAAAGAQIGVELSFTVVAETQRRRWKVHLKRVLGFEAPNNIVAFVSTLLYGAGYHTKIIEVLDKCHSHESV